MVNEVPLVMPKMSMTMSEGTFLTWHKSPGDPVHEGDVVCEVATDKVDMEVEATVAGTLTRLLAEPEDVIEVGAPLAYIATEQEELLGGLFDTPPPEADTAKPITETSKPSAETPKAVAETPKSSAKTFKPITEGSEPVAEASEPSVETFKSSAETFKPSAGTSRPNAEISKPSAETFKPIAEGSGLIAEAFKAGAHVVQAPAKATGSSAEVGALPACTAGPVANVVEASAQVATVVPAAVPAARRRAAERGIDLATITPTGPWSTIRLSDLDSVPNRPANRGRVAVARRMAASAQVPQFVLYRDLDLEAVERTHSWTTLLTYAYAAALRRHPELNASWTDGAVQRHEHIGVALAVDTPRGLLAPVLTDPDRDGLDTLAARIRDIVTRARQGKLGLAELSAPATTTLSNLGGFGVAGFQALLTPPQATALAVGAIEPKVVPVPGGLGVRLRCTVSLSVDHRVADGADGARLLATLQELL